MPLTLFAEYADAANSGGTDRPKKAAYQSGERCVIGIPLCFRRWRCSGPADAAGYARRGPMDGLPAITAAHMPRALRAAWRRSVGAIRRSRAAGYLRGLTAAPVRAGVLVRASASL